MKHKRVIRIKDPLLQKIRYNLRGLILEAASVKMSQLRENISRLDKLGKKKEAHEINRKVQEIIEALKRSICMCEVCGTGKEDMIYVPKFKSWLCIACAKMNRISIPQ